MRPSFYQPLISLQAAQVAYDNRAEPEVDEDAPNIDALTDEVIEVMGRACRAMPRDAKACADLLREASQMLAALADEVA